MLVKANSDKIKANHQGDSECCALVSRSVLGADFECLALLFHQHFQLYEGYKQLVFTNA